MLEPEQTQEVRAASELATAPTVQLDAWAEMGQGSSAAPERTDPSAEGSEADQLATALGAGASEPAQPAPRPQSAEVAERRAVEGADQADAAQAPSEAVATVPLAELRALVLRAYPQAIPELVQGTSLRELIGSAEEAIALRERLLAEARAAVGAALPPVSAGAPPRRAEPVDPTLPPLLKIVRALTRAGD